MCGNDSDYNNKPNIYKEISRHYMEALGEYHTEHSHHSHSGLERKAYDHSH